MGQDGAGRSSLAQLASRIDRCFFELCIQNMGRPSGAVLWELVDCTRQLHDQGFSRHRVALQLAWGCEEMLVDAAGYRLTASEERYKSQWVDVIYTTLRYLRRNQVGGGTATSPSRADATSDQIVNMMGAGMLNRGYEGQAPPPSAVGDELAWEPEEWMASLVQRVLAGQLSGDEQSLVRFDRGLATAGASGGIMTERKVQCPIPLPPLPPPCPREDTEADVMDTRGSTTSRM
eukprot:jgi/Mesvir1/25522/Mv01772-RA.1